MLMAFRDVLQEMLLIVMFEQEGSLWKDRCP